MTTKKERYQTEAAKVAKLIRAELKVRFPKTKFGVRSENFSGGNAVEVSWDLGPTTSAVGAVVNKYKGGWFDGMTDSYNIEHTLGVDENGKIEQLPSVRFVGTGR